MLGLVGMKYICCMIVHSTTTNKTISYDVNFK